MIRIEIKTDNAAFEDDPGLEVASILRDIADSFEGGAYSVDSDERHKILESNGNACGFVIVKGSE